jgi:hypothetical protein
MYEAVIGSINAGGGVACRKLVAQYWEVNPADQAAMQQTCLEMASSGAYVALDNGSFSTSPLAVCFPQKQMPLFIAGYLTDALADRFYPYLLGFSSKDTLYRNTVFGLRGRGFFDPAKGFRKLGFVYRSCERGAVDVFLRSLHDAGISNDQIVQYDAGCPEGVFVSPADIGQAVLQFRRSGVTHVTWANFVGDFRNFSEVAEQQGFRPAYGLPDDNLIAIAYSSQRPNDNNVANAIVVTPKRNGEERTPGMTPHGATQRCDAILRTKGLAPTYTSSPIAGQTCDQLWMLQAALSRAPSLDRTSLAAGLQASGTLDFAFPIGPADFSGRRRVTGSNSWRVLQFFPECSCWRVVEPAFRPAFP